VWFVWFVDNSLSVLSVSSVVRSFF
jgi:hypothetical protein